MLSNSIKYTQTGYVKIKAIRQDSMSIMLSVEDTGVGINEED